MTLERHIECELAFRHRRERVLQVMETTGAKAQSPQRECHVWALVNNITDI